MTRRVLIVDDQQEWLDFVGSQLRKHDLEVQFARTPQAAFDELGQANYDLVIANIRGGDLLRRIADRYPQERVVCMTADPSPREAAEAYRLGALDYFTRSFNPQALANVVEQALRYARHRRAPAVSRPNS